MENLYNGNKVMFSNNLKIPFDDGSFISFEFDTKESLLKITLCGKKNNKDLTIASVNLSKEQTEQVISFLK